MTTIDLVKTLSLVISTISLVYAILAARRAIFQRFTEQWVRIDDIFISHPEMHKYFYDSEIKKTLPKDDAQLQLGISIAEKIRDIIQYTEPLAMKVGKDFAYSCYKYMERIQSTALYKYMEQINPIQYEEEKPIGSLLREQLKKKHML